MNKTRVFLSCIAFFLLATTTSTFTTDAGAGSSTHPELDIKLLTASGLALATDPAGRMLIGIPPTPPEYTALWGTIIPRSRIMHDTYFNTIDFPSLNSAQRWYGHAIWNAGCPPLVPYHNDALQKANYAHVTKIIKEMAPATLTDFEHYQEGLKFVFASFFQVRKPLSLPDAEALIAEGLKSAPSEGKTLTAEELVLVHQSKPLGLEALTIDTLIVIYQHMAGSSGEVTIEADLRKKLEGMCRTWAKYANFGMIHPICLAAYAFTGLIRAQAFPNKNNELALLITNIILAKGGYIPIVCDRRRFDVVVNEIKTLDQGRAHDRAIVYLAQEVAIIAAYYGNTEITPIDPHGLRELVAALLNTIAGTAFDPLTAPEFNRPLRK